MEFDLTGLGSTPAPIPIKPEVIALNMESKLTADSNAVDSNAESERKNAKYSLQEIADNTGMTVEEVRWALDNNRTPVGDCTEEQREWKNALCRFYYQARGITKQGNPRNKADYAKRVIAYARTLNLADSILEIRPVFQRRVYERLAKLPRRDQQAEADRLVACRQITANFRKRHGKAVKPTESEPIVESPVENPQPNPELFETESESPQPEIVCISPHVHAIRESRDQCRMLIDSADRSKNDPEFIRGMKLVEKQLECVILRMEMEVLK